MLTKYSYAQNQEDKSTESNSQQTSTEMSKENADGMQKGASSHSGIQAPTDLFKQQQQDLKHYMKASQVSSFLVGPNEYLMMVSKHKTAMNRGVMIIIPDWQQSAISPKVLNHLQQDLPEYGWTTITIHPPQKPTNYPSILNNEEERIAANNKTLTTYKENLAALLKATYEKAKSYPGVIITIAQGNHAALVVDLYQEELVGMPSALIMLSSYMPTQTENDSFAQQLAYSSYPVLDLYLKRDHRLVLNNAIMRKHLVKNELKSVYRQKQLTNHLTTYYPRQTLIKEIIGWLKTIGW